MKKRSLFFEHDFLIYIVIGLLLVIFYTNQSEAGPVKTLEMDSSSIPTVYISTKGTVLSFPVKPKKVILGRAGSFGIEYVESDLAISPLTQSSRSNLFVYLPGRRFSFDLSTATQGGVSLIHVRDKKSMKVNASDL